MSAPLTADVVRVLRGWKAPDVQQEALRLEFLEHSLAEVSPALRSTAPHHVTASALVVSSDGERFALVLHRKFNRWLQTGGHCEPDDESLAAAAEREAREESGIRGLVVDPTPLRLDRHPVKCWPDGDHLDVQFLAVAPAGAELKVSTESLDLRWFEQAEVESLEDQSVRLLVESARKRLQGTLRPTPTSENGSPTR